jgi:hypothetical protein
MRPPRSLRQKKLSFVLHKPGAVQATEEWANRDDDSPAVVSAEASETPQNKSLAWNE